MNKIEELFASTAEGKRELCRADLRVQVTESILMLMQHKGISKSDLANALGVSRSAITQALSGSRNLSLSLLADISSALGTKVVFELAPLTPDATVVISAQQVTAKNYSREVAEIQIATEQQLSNPAVPTTGTAEVSEITWH